MFLISEILNCKTYINNLVPSYSTTTAISTIATTTTTTIKQRTTALRRKLQRKRKKRRRKRRKRRTRRRRNVQRVIAAPAPIVQTAPVVTVKMVWQKMEPFLWHPFLKMILVMVPMEVFKCPNLGFVTVKETNLPSYCSESEPLKPRLHIQAHNNFSHQASSRVTVVEWYRYLCG